jgi:hypothetical protein
VQSVFVVRPKDGKWIIRAGEETIATAVSKEAAEALAADAARILSAEGRPPKVKEYDLITGERRSFHKG